MEISENFAFLKQEFPHAAESASFAERHVYGDPRASCFHARHALERLLIACLQGREGSEATEGHEPGRLHQRPCLPRTRARGRVAEGRIHPAGGQRGGPRQQAAGTGKALDVVRELYHVLYWTGRTYLRKGAESLQGKTFDESLVPNVEPATTPASVQELEALKAQRDAAAEARKEIESELDGVA